MLDQEEDSDPTPLTNLRKCRRTLIKFKKRKSDIHLRPEYSTQTQSPKSPGNFQNCKPKKNLLCSSLVRFDKQNVRGHGGFEAETNNNEEDFLSKTPHHLHNWNVITQEIVDQQVKNPDPTDANIFDQHLNDVLELLNEKKCFLEESFDLQPRDLPNMNNFDRFEREAFEGLKYFEDIDDIEKHDHSMSEPTTKKTVGRKQKSGKVVHQCKECGQVFMCFLDFIHHQESHKKDFACEICGKVVRKSSQLASHMESHLAKGHSGIGKEEQDLEESCHVRCAGSPAKIQSPARSSSKIRSFSCKSCAQVYDTKSELVKHQILQHDMHRANQGNFKHIAWMKNAAQGWYRALSYSHYLQSQFGSQKSN